ncbi:MAG: hypothetical protein ABI342_06790 [Nitrososphaera sp.]|jgi:hypothetical protein
MPHVVLDKKINLGIFAEKFVSIIEKKSSLVKLTDVFVGKNKALVSALVIDELHQEFLIEISTHDDSTTIRLFSLADPQKKTDGVKTALGLVAANAMSMFPDVSILRTNIQDFIPVVGKN